MKGYIVYQKHITIDEKSVIQLFGKLENGQSFVSQNTIEPYFFVISKDVKRISPLLKKYKVEKTDFKNKNLEPVSKISSKNQTELNKLYNTIRKKVPTYEADIKPAQRFLMDKDILGTIEISDKEPYDSAEKVDRIYHNPEISPAPESYKPKLKILSLDIETEKDSGALFCIGLYSHNYKKVFLISNEDKKIPNAIHCSSEIDCLEKFREEIISQDPDIITGWNLIDFDLKYLQILFDKHKIPFDLGRSNSPARIQLESSFFRTSKADIPGRQVLDALNLIRDPFLQQSPTMRNAQFQSYTLEDVSQEILKKGKLLKGKNRHEEISELYKNNQKKLVEYNLLDCVLPYEILEKTQLIELAIERSKLTGLPLDKLTASIAAFDSLYIREAHKRKLVSPTTIFSNEEEKLKGGYVKLPSPGIYNNVLILDFKSLYPSILRTFNIDPFSYLDSPEKNSLEAPNGAHFKKESGVLSKLIEKLHKAREQAKKEKNEFANYAIKIIMLSFWGVLASKNCRYFNMNMGNAITSFARFIIQTTGSEIEKLGFKVLYQDTDSNFVVTNLPKEKANALGLKLEKQINDFWKSYVKEKYSQDSFLELQFEKQYLSLMIPKNRATEFAAKKRYAGLVEKNGKEILEVTGLEAIRGDWTDAARDFQRSLLLKLFKKEPIKDFIRDYIKKIRSGDLDSKLIYRKQIRKALKDYTKTTPPHVKAARLLPQLDSNIISYLMTTEGPEPIQNLKHKIDYDHYIEKQISPIANQILELLDENFSSLIASSKQATLF